MKQLILKTLSNNSVFATFNYDLDKNYDLKLAFQFGIQQQQQIAKKFDSNIFIRFDKTEIKENPLKVSVFATFTGISAEKIKEVLEKEFPIAIVIGG